MRILFFSFLIIVAVMNTYFMSMAHADESKIVTLDVPDMTCKFCPFTIRTALEKVPGVTEAKVSYETKTATVTFEPDKTTVEALTMATTNAGYPSTLKQ